ncbi:DUF2235 domain-containing protein [Candidatus Mycobacterium wuenschmannii]|uniref:DUF2235 domain-containing protein n=1 Tax=Candidatus Mycobacterium wuenschmannii TaxID=3027808 RepID=A0ABY8VWI9_9MYCO|nr:DUF2235 domain-containing protein [Candidatus Mycobacterium wuenschmannii]WIM86542.1 DUF2235 domain-containing protein [Candidatus Mycobacterium wuenschmannii]
MPKRLVVCCDGTWDSPDERDRHSPTPTNVTKVALSVAREDRNGREQRTFYRLGVGTRRPERISGGGFGFGVSRAIRDTYRFLVENYEPGDQLYFFGFSRGAFTARSTVGFIRNCGILRRENAGLIDRAFALYRSRSSTNHPKSVESTLFRSAYSYEPRIRFIGVWDTVGAMGIPITGSALIAVLNRRTRFHDTSLSSTVDAAFHALAIDEKRNSFCPTLWTTTSANQRVEQVWFTGVHRDVGGGYSQHGLSDIPLLWMMDRAQECGLAFVEASPRASLARVAAGLPDEDKDLREAMLAKPDALADPHNSWKGWYRIPRPHRRELGKSDRAHEWAASTAVERRKAGLEPASPQLAAYLDGGGQVMDVSAAIES